MSSTAKDIHYKVRVENDHIQKLANGRPVPALAELIWNSVDADALRVDVEIESSDFGMQSITVRDDGHGIPHEEVEVLFGSLGGSWKGHGNRSKKKKRILHGKEGKGRFKALALGRVADWTVVYRKSKKLFKYTITIIRDDLVDVRVSKPIEVKPPHRPGVEVRVSELDRNYASLESDQAVQSLAQIFALYLTNYTDVAIYVEHDRVDPSLFIAARKTLPLAEIRDDDSNYAAEIDVIEWKSAPDRWIFFCGDEGFPFHQITPTFHTPGVQFTAYLKSSYISELQRRGVLELSEMNAPLQATFEEATTKIKDFFHDRELQAARSEIEQWKAEKVYPYTSDPQTSVEQAERQVFDIVALNVNKHLPDFSESSHKTKAFQLRMLRQAIEKGPDELQLILKEVLDLPERKQQELAKLLEEADLANVISASKLVADRLQFVHGVEALLFDPESKKLLKERSQLHRILAENNTWIFGEQYNLTVDDQSLTAVLRKHRKLIGADTKIDAPVKRIDGKTGIVDLMLSRSVPQSRSDELEHLVVELKRPSVTVGAEEITQVEKYAYTVADDERFRHLHTRWSFWVISNDLDGFAKKRTRQKDKPRGLVSETDDGNVQVWVKTWSEIIAECKARMRFVQEHLQANVDKDRSLKYLKKTYAKYLADVVEDPPDGPKAKAKADAP